MNRRTFMQLAALAPAAVGFDNPALAQESPTAKRYRACVIGNTQRGEYGHSLHLVWGLRDDIDVVGLSDPDESGRAKHAAECNAQRTYSDYREMLETEKPDLVSVAPRWPDDHLEYLLACANARAHGIVEKPLAADLEAADAIVTAMAEKNLKWSIAFNYRASPLVHHARRLILDEGLIGEILEVRGRGKEDNRGGAEDLIVLGTHVVDLMRFFMGTPRWCNAGVSVDGRPVVPADVHEGTEPVGPIAGNRIHATYEFDGGKPGYFASIANRDGNQGRFGMDVYGGKGIVTIRCVPVPHIRVCQNGTWASGRSGMEWTTLPDMPTPPQGDQRVSHYKPIIDDLIAAIDENRPPAVSIEDGRNAVEMLQAVFASAVAGGRVRLPLEQRKHPLKDWDRV